MKICVFIIFQLCPWIIYVGDWALRWTEGDERVQVFFVMLFFPVVMNALQYYIVDSFIKNQKPKEPEPGSSEDGEDSDSESDEPDHRRRHSEHVDVRSQDEPALAKNGADVTVTEQKEKNLASDRVSQLRADPKTLEEYNPDTDGASSSSSPGQDGAATNHPTQAHHRQEPTESTEHGK